MTNAGVEGIEPPSTVLETVIIPLDHTPVGLTLLLALFFVKLAFFATGAVFL